MIGQYTKKLLFIEKEQFYSEIVNFMAFRPGVGKVQILRLPNPDFDVNCTELIEWRIAAFRAWHSEFFVTLDQGPCSLANRFD